MKNLSILIYSLGSGGAERQVSILLKELSTIYNITLILMNDTIFYEVPRDVEIVFLEKSRLNENGVKKFLKLPILGFKYKKILKEKNIEVSLSFMNRPNYINVFAKLLGSNVKTIISERIAPSMEYKTLSFKDIINRFLIKKLYKKANIIVCNSKGIKLDLDNWNIENVKVIYNMLNFECKYDEESEKFTFINIGRLELQKNHQLLIEAFKKANINAELLIIGEGCLRKDLENLIEKLELKDKVKLVGRQKNPEKFLAKADVFVFSSNYEGFPNVLLEALACELPIISTDCKSGPREILAPNTDFRKQTKEIEIAEYGVLTPVGDVEKMSEAMKMIYENKNLREKLKSKAKKRANDFSIEKIIKHWREIIEGNN